MIGGPGRPRVVHVGRVRRRWRQRVVHGLAKPIVEVIQIGEDAGLARLDIAHGRAERLVLLTRPDAKQKSSVTTCAPCHEGSLRRLVSP